MKSTAVLRLSGTYREDRHGNRAEGVLPDEIPEAPAHLTPAEAEIFNEVATKMHEAGTLAEGDVYTLELYAVQLALFRRARKELECGEDYVVTYTNKANATNETVGPWVMILHKSSAELLKLSAKLGLSPVDRNKASKANRKERENPGSLIK